MNSDWDTTTKPQEKIVELENRKNNLELQMRNLILDFLAYIQDYGMMDERTEEIEKRLNRIYEELLEEK